MNRSSWGLWRVRPARRSLAAACGPLPTTEPGSLRFWLGTSGAVRPGQGRDWRRVPERGLGAGPGRRQRGGGAGGAAWVESGSEAREGWGAEGEVEAGRADPGAGPGVSPEEGN